MLKFSRPLWKHQEKELFDSWEENQRALLCEMGCVAEGTIIKVSRGGACRKYPIEELYRKFNRIELSKRETGFSKKLVSYCRSYNGQLIQLNEVIGIFKRGLKDCVEIELKNGNKICVTSDHEILTGRGYVRAENLNVWDRIACDMLTKHHKKTTKKVKNKQQYLNLRVGKHHPFSVKLYDYRIKRPYYALEKHRIIFEANLNKLSLEDFQLATHSKNTFKFVNPKKFHIHHKDHNSKNNSLSNLECLTVFEHLKEHGKVAYKNFGHGAISYSGIRNFTTAGKKECYDISCKSPHNNFVANGIVVHNCGKTTMAIGWMRGKYKQNSAILPTLILAPVAVLHNWKDEIKLNSTETIFNATCVLEGSAVKRAALLSDLSKQIFITNYEALTMPALQKSLQARTWKVVICDEAQRIKSPQSKRFKNLLPLADKAKYRMLLTGTPILNSYLDLWALWRFLDRGETFSTNFFQFRARYFRDKNAGIPIESYFPNWVPLPDAHEKLTALIGKKSLRITKAECLSLPPVVEQTINVEMSKEQTRLYEQMLADLVAYAKGEGASATNALVKLLRLMQIQSGHLPLDNGEMVRIKDNPRLDILKDLLTDIAPAQKVIVWCIFKENYKEIAAVCEKLKIEYRSLTGAVKDKAKEINDFQNDAAVRVMIANPQAGGVGVNLTASSCAIYYNRSHSLEARLQSEARNHRGGSEIHDKITLIDLVCKNTIDEEILNALLRKESYANNVLDRLKALR